MLGFGSIGELAAGENLEVSPPGVSSKFLKLNRPSISQPQTHTRLSPLYSGDTVMAILGADPTRDFSDNQPITLGSGGYGSSVTSEGVGVTTISGDAKFSKNIGHTPDVTIAFFGSVQAPTVGRIFLYSDIEIRYVSPMYWEIKRYTTGGTAGVWGVMGLVSSINHPLIISFKGLNDPNIYYNGSKQVIAYKTAPSGSVLTGSINSGLFGQPGVADTSCYGSMTMFLRLKRAVTEAEGISLSQNPWQIFKEQSQRTYITSSTGTASVSFTNTLADSTNSIGFSVSPRLTIANTFASTSNALGFSVSPGLVLNSAFASINNTLNFTVTPKVILNNTLADNINGLNFTVSGYTGLELAQTLENINSTLAFSVSPKLTIATTLDDVVNALDFTVGGANAVALNSTLESILIDLNLEVRPRLNVANILANTASTLNFSVSPRLVLANTLENTVSSIFFNVNNVNSFNLSNTLENTNSTFNFTVSPKLSLSGTLADVQNTLAFTGYVNPNIYFETIRLGLKVNTSPSISLKINLVSSIPLEL